MYVYKWLNLLYHGSMEREHEVKCDVKDAKDPFSSVLFPRYAENFIEIDIVIMLIVRKIDIINNIG